MTLLRLPHFGNKPRLFVKSRRSTVQILASSGAVIKAESNSQTQSTSPKRAMGLKQLMPGNGSGGGGSGEGSSFSSIVSGMMGRGTPIDC